jgi:nucleoside-diphosphate-sugar epimerase
MPSGCGPVNCIGVRKVMAEQIKTAAVVGALGVIGRNLIAYLETLPGWNVLGLSRRSPDYPTTSRYVSVDLLDAADCKAKLAGLRDVTHIFYCAFQSRPTWAEHNAPNLAMLANAVAALEGPKLERVVLVQGTKIYGSHLGPFKTPAKETDPPHMLPNFYFDQQQWLEQQQQQQNRSWSWTALRPHAVCGFSVGSPMNLVTLIAVYAAISKELGLPLRFPGKPGAYDAVFQVVDADHLARAMVWSATAATAANEAFNVTNGDFFRWCNLWPRIADVFGVPVGPVQTIRLTEFMADKAPLWESLQRRHGLQAIPYGDLVAWPFGDYVFGCDWDIMSDTTKIRRAGFHDCVDSEDMMLKLLADFRAQKIVP